MNKSGSHALAQVRTGLFGMTVGLLCVLGGACAPSTPPAGALVPSANSPDAVSIDYPDMDHARILGDVAAHFRLRLDGIDRLNGRTSLKLRDVTWRQIFKVTLSPIGYGFYEKDGVVMIRPNEVIDALPDETRVFVLHHQPVQEVAEFLGRLFGTKVRLAFSETRLTCSAHPSRFSAIAQEIARLDAPGVVIRRFPRTPTFPSEVPALTPVSFEELGYLTLPTGDELTTQVFTLEHIDTRWIQPILATKLQGNGGRVVEDVRINALIVTAKVTEFPLLTAIVRYLDDPRWYKNPAQTSPPTDLSPAAVQSP